LFPDFFQDVEMTNSPSATAPAATIEQWIALNEEIAALVRLGVPLEQGLAELGQDLPGSTGKMAALLAERARRGESFPQVLAEQAATFPPVYRAVIESGLRAGRLPAALESLTRTLRRTLDLRRSVAAALIYPSVVFVVAWLFFAFFAAKIAPALAVAFREFSTPGAGFFAKLAKLGNTAGYWGPAVPTVVVLLFIGLIYASRRAQGRGGTCVAWLINCLPGTGKLFRWADHAMFTETLALLVENQVPLVEALPLAGEACGDRRLRAAARRATEALRQGRPLGAAVANDPVLPPLLQWLIPSGTQRNALLSALQQAAEIYQHRAEHQSDWLQLVLPLTFTFVLAGGITLLYALMLYAPYVSLLKTLGAP
jgi:general secretion pathway protein F